MASSSKVDNENNSGPWYEGPHGERIAVRLSNGDTNGMYAIVESVAATGSATPMHLHRNEAEQVLIIEGAYRIAVGEKVFEKSGGDSMILPRGVPHSWRNISNEPGRMVVILTPAGFEQSVQTIRNRPPEKLEAVAASYGWYIVGPPVSP